MKQQEKQQTAASGLSGLWVGSMKFRFFMNGEHVPYEHEGYRGYTCQKLYHRALVLATRSRIH
jgi:hypothetical protein